MLGHAIGATGTRITSCLELLELAALDETLRSARDACPELDLAWRAWCELYRLPSPTARNPTYRLMLVRRGRFAQKKLCIGSRRAPGCCRVIGRERPVISRAFNEPRRCRVCELEQFTSLTRAWSDLSRNHMSVRARRLLLQRIPKAIARVNGGMTLATYFRRVDIEKLENIASLMAEYGVQPRRARMVTPEWTLD